MDSAGFIQLRDVTKKPQNNKDSVTNETKRDVNEALVIPEPSNVTEVERITRILTFFLGTVN